MRWRCLVVGVLSLAPLGARPYYLGLDPGWTTGLTAQARREWVVRSGCQMPRVDVRLDQFGRPAGARVIDAEVAAYTAAGATPLLALSYGGRRWTRLPDGGELPTGEPEGLELPVFAGGGDEPQPGDRLNPRNRLAWLVGRLAERYDGDGTADAPGSPVVRYLSLAAEPPARAASDGSSLLPRWVLVSRAAARFANPDCRLGWQVSDPDALEALLSRDRSASGAGFDFVDFAAGRADSSDGGCQGPNGLVARARAMREVLYRHGAWSELVGRLAGGGSVAAEGRRQRSAAPQSQLLAAALGLVTAQWCGLSDCGPQTAGLLALLPGPVESGPVVVPRESYWAWLTLARLLGRDLASGRARLVTEESVGAGARAYRFECDRQDLVVAWADDGDGRLDRRVKVRLPLRAMTRYARYEWDYALTGRPADTIAVGAEAPLVEVGVDPVYLLAAEPVAGDRPAPPPAAPPTPRWRVSASSPAGAERGFDADSDTCWTSAPGQLRPWWRIDFADGPVTTDRVRLKLGRLPSVGWHLEVSDDGQLWRTVSAPVVSSDWATLTVGLTSRVSSAQWRVVFENRNGGPVALYEIEIGGRSARER